MLFDYTYLLKKFDAAFFNSSINGEFIIPLNEDVFGKQPELFQLLMNSKNTFCFCITKKFVEYNIKFIKEEVIQNLIRLLFLPNYMRLNGSFVFFIEQENEKLHSVKEIFFDQLKKQGINEVIFEPLKYENYPQTDLDGKNISVSHPQLNYFLENGENFDELINHFNLLFSFNKRWIINVSSTDDFYRKNKLIQKFESWITVNKPFEVKIITQYNIAGKDNNKLETENKVLKFKLENSAYYLKIIRVEAHGYMRDINNLNAQINHLKHENRHPQIAYIPPAAALPQPANNEFLGALQNQVNAERNRANATLDWYKKEYEVLPLWYKRFGHIIKVAKGKRTFKSLFKND